MQHQIDKETNTLEVTYVDFFIQIIPTDGRVLVNLFLTNKKIRSFAVLLIPDNLDHTVLEILRQLNIASDANIKKTIITHLTSLQ